MATLPDAAPAFNGVDGSTGAYITPALSLQQIAALARGEPPPPDLDELKAKQAADQPAAGAPLGLDVNNLAETGWGVIFPAGDSSRLEACLSELLTLRRDQAGNRYKCFTGDKGLQPDENSLDWLVRNGSGWGQAKVRKVPYFLLIVGGPERIPYRFQQELSVNYAIGRIAFASEPEYREYAHGVVLADRATRKPRTACFFGVRNPDDVATQLSADHLVTPLVDELTQDLAHDPDWQFEKLLADDATKTNLKAKLHAGPAPSLLFTASHGLGFRPNDLRQAATQGALLCQEWPGPNAPRQPLPEEFYFAAKDVGDDADLSGTIAFHFACFGAGTPRFDDFAHAGEQRKIIAESPFVARLPQRMLGKPGGALAVIGHVDRAWGCSFLGEAMNEHITAFQNCLGAVMKGHRVGAAMESFASAHADFSVRLVGELEFLRHGARPNDARLASLWTANNDARNYTVVGDPAVRLHDGTPART